MSKKLLNKTLKSYTLYSIVMMLAIAPIFYFVSIKLYVHETDEALILRKEEFIKNSLSSLQEKDIDVWNKFNRDVKIKPTKHLFKDSLFNTFYYDTLVSENEPYRELNSAINIDGKPYTFVAKMNLVEKEDLIENIASLFLILIFLVLIGFYFITKKMSLTLWKPFYHILDQIERFEIDKNQSINLVDSEIEEFNRLNQSIQNLIVKNTSIYKSQKEFIENASHELQTPLAVFQAKIDTLIQRSDITEEQFKELNSLNANVSKLKRLNKNLLLLSKLENDGFWEIENININELIEKNKVFFEEQAKAKNIKIEIDIKGVLEVKSDPILAEILISNLILNSIRHNRLDGMIHIFLTKKKFQISNSGNIKALKEEHLFNRFAKANASKNGNGLGLAIVKKIADQNNWCIQYSFKEELHTFSLTDFTF